MYQEFILFYHNIIMKGTNGMFCGLRTLYCKYEGLINSTMAMALIETLLNVFFFS